jgi:hypothetical protein
VEYFHENEHSLPLSPAANDDTEGKDVDNVEVDEKYDGGVESVMVLVPRIEHY